MGAPGWHSWVMDREADGLREGRPVATSAEWPVPRKVAIPRNGDELSMLKWPTTPDGPSTRTDLSRSDSCTWDPSPAGAREPGVEDTRPPRYWDTGWRHSGRVLGASGEAIGRARRP